MTVLNLDLSDVAERMGYEPIPAGTYEAQIVETELTHSQAGSPMLNLTWLIMDDEHAGRKVFDRVMLGGSDKAKAFGLRKLKAIAVAIGHPNPNRVNNAEELHGRPCLVSIAIKPFNGEDRNETRNFKPLENRPAEKTAPPAAKSATAPPPKKSAAQTKEPDPFAAPDDEDLPF